MNFSEKTVVVQLKRLSGLDFHVFFTLLMRSWGIFAGSLTIFLLPFWLTPDQQGFYYSFASLLTLQVFFELGLNQVIIQLVSHDVAHLKIHNNGSFSGDTYRYERLRVIRRLVHNWYLIAAIIFTAIIGTFGFVFFEHRSDIPTSNWLPVWCFVVAFTAVNLFLSPQLAIVEATGHIGQVARLRLIQSILGYGIFWILLLSGAGLWVVAVVPGVSALSTWGWLNLRGDNLWHKTALTPLIPFSWRKDVFPLQWRLAVSWISGYFIFNLFTPIIFFYHGSKEAGRFGMSMAIFNAVTTLGISWITAKAPLFAMHISRNEFTELNRTFRGVLVRSISFTILLSAVILVMVAVATDLEWPIAKRITEFYTLVAIAVSAILNVIVFAYASYMRAHLEEPMAPLSVVAALLTIAVVFLTAKSSLVLMMALNASIITFISLPWTLILFRKYFNRGKKFSVNKP
jgi:hypothetical protein